MDRTADIEGSQKKILDVAVRPARLAHGDTGIPVENDVTLPFVVERKWNAPAGHYPEQWFVIDPATQEILYESPERTVLIWGLAAWTDLSDTVPGGFSLKPGSYQAVFALGGTIGGEFDVEAVPVGTQAATTAS